MTGAIVPGIYQIITPLPFNPNVNTNVYLLKGSEGCLLLDTGWNTDEAFKALRDGLADVGIDFKDIRQIIVTHAHPDHYGLVDKVRQLSGAKVNMHYLDEELLRTRYAATEENVRQIEEWFYSNGVPRQEFPVTRAPVGNARMTDIPQPDVLLNGNETISTGIFDLKIIWTPGHSPGHLCLYDPDRKLLFSGDHVLPGIMPNVSLSPGSQGNPLADFLSSLESIKNLDVAMVLPSHEHIFYNFKARIEEIIEHHDLRASEILQNLGDGAKTAYEICGSIIWMPEYGGVKFQDLMPMDRRGAVSETLAHLRAMTVSRKVTTSVSNSIVYYERA